MDDLFVLFPTDHLWLWPATPVRLAVGLRPLLFICLLLSRTLVQLYWKKTKKLVIYPNVNHTFLAWSLNKNQCLHWDIFYVIEMIVCVEIVGGHICPTLQIRWLKVESLFFLYLCNLLIGNSLSLCLMWKWALLLPSPPPPWVVNVHHRPAPSTTTRAHSASLATHWFWLVSMNMPVVCCVVMWWRERSNKWVLWIWTFIWKDFEGCTWELWTWKPELSNKMQGMEIATFWKKTPIYG